LWYFLTSLLATTLGIIYYNRIQPHTEYAC